MEDKNIDGGRRNFLLGATAVVGTAGMAGLATPFCRVLATRSQSSRAGAPVKIDISKLVEGEMLGPIPAWRDKPIFVIKRSQDLLKRLNSKNDRLADPDSERVQQPAYAKNGTRSIKTGNTGFSGFVHSSSCAPKFSLKFNLSNSTKIGLVGSSVRVMAQSLTWLAEFTPASQHPLTLRFLRTTTRMSRY